MAELASLREVFEALLEYVNRVEVGEHQALAVPLSYYELEADELEARNAAENFAFTLYANMVQRSEIEFRPEGRFIWDIYRSVVTDRVLATEGEPGDSFARKFAELETDISIPLTDPGTQLPYFVTSVAQNTLRDEAWSPVNLPSGQIRELAKQLPARYKELLKRFGASFVDQRFVESISFDKTTLVLIRSWFKPEVFSWRFWDLPGTVISSGTHPPDGSLTHYQAKLFVVRNLSISIAAVADDTEKRADGGLRIPRVLAENMPALIHAASVSPMRMKHDVVARMRTLRAHEPNRSISSIVGAIDRDLSTLRTVAPPVHDVAVLGPRSAPDSSSGFLEFPVPIAYKTAEAREAAEVRLRRVQGEIRRITMRLGTLNAVVADLLEEIRKLEKRSGIFTHLTARLRLPSLRLSLQRNRASIARLLESRGTLSEEEGQLQKFLDETSTLASLGHRPEAYVLAIINQRVPKSPNPDPRLFT